MLENQDSPVFMCWTSNFLHFQTWSLKEETKYALTGASVSFWSGSPGRCDGRLAAGKAQPLQVQAPKSSPSGSVQPITPPFPNQKTTGRRCSFYWS